MKRGASSCKVEVKVCGYSPAQDLVFHIFSSRMMMAARWERSPVSRKMFMFVGAPAGSKPIKDFKTCPVTDDLLTSQVFE